MPPPTLMVMSNKGAGGTVQPYFLLGGTTLDPTPDGTAFSASQFTPTTTAGASMAGMMIEAFGKRFCLHAGVVRERDQGGSGNWGTVYTASPVPTTVQGHAATTGLHLLFPNGTPTLAFLGATSGNGLYLFKTTNGTSWTATLISSPFGGGIILTSGRSCVFGDSVYFAMNFNNATIMWAYNLRLSALTTWANGAIVGASIADFLLYGDFCVHKGKLFFYTDYGSGYSEGRGLWRLDGATWTQIIISTAGTGTNTSHRGAAFSDGDDIICLGRHSGGILRPLMLRVQSPHTTTTPTNSFVFDFTTASTPLFGLSGSFSLGGGQWYAAKDITDPGSPATYLWYSGNAGGINSGTLDCFQYNGWTTPLTPLGAGVSAASFTLHSAGLGPNDRIPAKPVARPQFDGLPQEVLGGRKRFFRLYGTSPADAVIQQAHNADQVAPSVISTLAAGSLQLEDPIDVTGLVGNLGEVALEALSPAAGDAYVVSATDGDSSLTPGAVAIAVGDIVQFDGANWTLAVANVSNFPPFGTHATLNSTTALISPYTDGVDDGKTVSFAGASLSGQVLSTPMSTTSQMMLTADNGASLWSYIHNASADGLMAGNRHTVVLDPI